MHGITYPGAGPIETPIAGAKGQAGRPSPRSVNTTTPAAPTKTLVALGSSCQTPTLPPQSLNTAANLRLGIILVCSAGVIGALRQYLTV